MGSYAENQRITAVRKVFQRGVINPMINIDILWKDYCAFENVSIASHTEMWLLSLAVQLYGELLSYFSQTTGSNP